MILTESEGGLVKRGGSGGEGGKGGGGGGGGERGGELGGERGTEVENKGRKVFGSSGGREGQARAVVKFRSPVTGGRKRGWLERERFGLVRFRIGNDEGVIHETRESAHSDDQWRLFEHQVRACSRLAIPLRRTLEGALERIGLPEATLRVKASNHSGRAFRGWCGTGSYGGGRHPDGLDRGT